MVTPFHLINTVPFGLRDNVGLQDLTPGSHKGIRAAKELFRTRTADLYCSILTKKELLSKTGLRESESKNHHSVKENEGPTVDDDINRKYIALMRKYGDAPDSIVDYVIAATAWSKKLPLLTRNRKHFKHIKEIKLSPGYEME